MKKSIHLLFTFLLMATALVAQDEYYFGGLGKLNPAVPTPESFFGFRIGTSLVRYDKVVEYFRLLAGKSDRASLQMFGKSWEDREQDGKTFEPGSAWAVPLRQRQFRVLQSIFEENETNGFDDKTTFYDISAWMQDNGVKARVAQLPFTTKTASADSCRPHSTNGLRKRTF